MGRVTNQEQFLEKVQQIHPNLDFSKFKYIDSKTKSTVICHEVDEFGEEHGEFLISPNHLLAHRGCAKCAKINKITKEIIVKKIDKYNVNGYQYEIPNTINSKTKVYFTCNEGHKFSKRVDDIKSSIECPICKGITSVLYDENGDVIPNKHYDVATFISESKKIHGDKYDYSKVEYKNCNIDVLIYCKEHNEWFKQKPYYHLRGLSGCKFCKRDKVSEKLRSNVEEQIKKANEIHEGRYDYSKVEYVNSTEKVCVICPKHGEFWVTFDNHIYRKSGCPKCQMPHLEIEIDKILNRNNIEYICHDKSILGGLELDFYIPSKRIGIECQGIQHFVPKSFGSKNKEKVLENFEKQIERDKRKSELCKEKGIKLFYFLDEEHNCYMKQCEDIFFNNTDALIEYIMSNN